MHTIQYRMPRHEIRAPVAYWGANLEGGGTIANISYSGALIEPASRSAVPGTSLRLFVSGMEFTSVEVASEVVRTTPSGFAVCFVDLGPKTLCLLSQLLD